jgi:hypothetical protein
MAQLSSTSGLQDYLEGGENIGKPFYFNLPPDIAFTLFTPIKGRIDSLTVYIYNAVMYKHFEV